MRSIPPVRATVAFFFATWFPWCFGHAQVTPVVPAPVEGDGGHSEHAETGPNEWFDKTSVDLGTFLEGETAKAEFAFKNPNTDPHRLRNIQPSCTCSKAFVRVGGRRYSIENEPAPHTIYRLEAVEGVDKKEAVQFIAVGPGESGAVEVEMDLRGVQGPKSATVSVQTSDEKLRLVSLKTSAIVTSFFSLVPPEINLNKMNWQERRDFTCQISSPLREDFEILGHDPLPNQMTVEYRKEKRDGRAVWILNGTYGPNVDPHAGGGVVNLKTDVEGKAISLRVMAWVEGPLNIRPGSFVPLGVIRQTEGATKEIEFEPTDDYDLKLESYALKNLSIPEEFIKVTSRKDGKILKVELTVAPQAPRRLLRGDLEIQLNHPAAKRQEIQFNGFVR
jgi:hypothetical protein